MQNRIAATLHSAGSIWSTQFGHRTWPLLQNAVIRRNFNWAFWGSTANLMTHLGRLESSEGMLNMPPSLLLRFEIHSIANQVVCGISPSAEMDSPLGQARLISW